MTDLSIRTISAAFDSPGLAANRRSGQAFSATQEPSVNPAGNVSSQLGTVATLIDEAVRAFDGTLLNRLNSAVLSVPQALARGTTVTDLAVLNNDYTIAPPDAQYQLDNSPTVNSFMNAAYGQYAITGSPLGLRPFLVNGRQLEVVDQASGLSSRVWVDEKTNKVIIAYAGTSSGDVGLFLNPTQIPGQILASAPTVVGKTAAAQDDGVKFAQYVVHEAALQGYSSDDIYVTGHSLGGNIAEYVAQQTGLGGIGWSDSGLPISDTAVGDGSNFISLGRYGDIVTVFSSDIEGAQPAAPQYDESGGQLPHWGTLILVGNPDNQVALNERLNKAGNGALAAGLDFAVGPSGIAHNLVGIEKDIGGELAQFTVYPGSFDGAQGPVFNIAGDNLAEAIAANQSRTEFHATYLPGTSPADSLSPSAGLAASA